MIKQLHFVGQSDQGILAQALFGSSGCFEKTAGAPPFSDWETGEELRKAVGGITKKDREQACYVLVNALGAGEFYGSNINADWFPWNSLCHEGDDYGYRTFLNANAFQHHKNKDPARAFGKPLFSILNPMMKRVELIIRLDREKARAEGADGIITRIDMGEFPDVSMGCKVPWDECSICSAHSKTKDDYCLHMRPPEELRYLYGPNRILVDGRKIFVKNIYPRFFDISFVFIGADKTAKVMAKLASAQFERNELSADAGHRFYIDLGHTKTRPHLDELAKLPLPGVLGASTVMGMILKPQEFQYLALKRMGEDDLLEQLERKNEVFPSVSEGFMSVDITLEAGDEAGDGIKKAMEILSSYVSERGAFGQPFSIRVHLHRDTPKLPLPMQSAIGHPLLNKLGAAYNGYRREVMTKLSKATEVLQRDPRLREVVLGEGLGNMMMKTSSSSPLLTLDSVVYMMGAYLEDRRLLHTTAVEAVDHVWLS